MPGIERARAAGVGCNVFLTTASLPQLDDLAAALPPLGVHAMSIETAGFLPTPRSRRNERLRPTLADLRPAAARIAGLTVLPDQWAGLETRTEAAYVSRALTGDWPDAQDRTPGEVALVCRPNLDVYSGLAGLYRPGTATCAPTASPRCWAAPSPGAANAMTSCGSALAASRAGRASRPLRRRRRPRRLPLAGIGRVRVARPRPAAGRNGSGPRRAVSAAHRTGPSLRPCVSCPHAPDLNVLTIYR